MVRSLGLNDKNDIYLGSDGNIVLLSGIEATASACGTISRSQLAEMVLTITQGLPNFKALWIGVPNLRIWQSYLLVALQNVKGVKKVNNLTLTQENNVLSYTATIETDLGSTTISG